MDTILLYLENMFAHLPKTADVERAKTELGSMMEDKYNELISEGKKENEAVGIVISEFGNLDELADELGLKKSEAEGITTETGKDVKFVSRQEAEEYLNTAKKTSKWIALGVALCICCPIPIMFWSGMNVSDLVIVCFGVIPLFLMVGIAVALFIFNETKMERFEYLKKESIQIDSILEKSLRQMEQDERPAATTKLVIGVMCCIFSVIPLLVVGSITESDATAGIAVCVLLLCVAVGVSFIIQGTNKKDCIEALLQEGDYTRKNKKGNKLIDIVAGIYWPIVVAIYLGWSFVTMKWGVTWVIWPTAGVLFGAIAIICKAIGQTTK